MNAEVITELINSNDLSNYIYSLSNVFNYTDRIDNNSHRYQFSYLCDETKNIIDKELTLFVFVDNINKFLEELTKIKYKRNITNYPIFQYIKNMISNLENILIELLILDKKTKSILIKSINNNILFSKGYSKYCLEIQFTKLINFSKYKEVDYNVLSYLKDLKTATDNAKNMFNSLKYSINYYLIYYSINIPFKNIIYKNEFKNELTELLNKINSILENYWIDYLKANRLTMELQLIIQDINNMAVKAMKNNNLEYNNKLDKTAKVLTLLIESYSSNTTNKLILVVNYSKIQLFLSSISEHLDNYFIH